MMFMFAFKNAALGIKPCVGEHLATCNYKKKQLDPR